MNKIKPRRSGVDTWLMVFFLTLVLWFSPLKLLWASANLPWFMPYVVWAGLVLLVAGLQRGRDRFEF